LATCEIFSSWMTGMDGFLFTVVEGSDFVGEGTPFELDTNVSIAKNLGVPVILVVLGEGKPPPRSSMPPSPSCAASKPARYRYWL
jgi:hypothetical protein